MSRACLRAVISALEDGDAVAPAVLVVAIGAAEGITQRLAQGAGVLPGGLGVQIGEDAARTQVAGCGIDAAGDDSREDGE